VDTSSTNLVKLPRSKLVPGWTFPSHRPGVSVSPRSKGAMFEEIVGSSESSSSRVVAASEWREPILLSSYWGKPEQAPLGVHQFNTTLCPAVTVAGRMLLPSLTEYFPAGKETGWLTCLDASCVPEASSTA
jgi:hypothetical protein